MFPAHHLSFEFIHGVFSLQKFSTHTHISTLFPFWVLGFLLFLKQSPPPHVKVLQLPYAFAFINHHRPYIQFISTKNFYEPCLMASRMSISPWVTPATVFGPGVHVHGTIHLRCSPALTSLWAGKQWKKTRIRYISTCRLREVFSCITIAFTTKANWQQQQKSLALAKSQQNKETKYIRHERHLPLESSL